MSGLEAEPLLRLHDLPSALSACGRRLGGAGRGSYTSLAVISVFEDQPTTKLDHQAQLSHPWCNGYGRVLRAGA